MPRRASKLTPTVIGDVLRIGDQTAVTTVGSPAWFTWLAGAHTFYYDGQAGTFTARPEQRRNGSFWYAFRLVDGRVYKVYLGKASALTAERLRLAARQLHDKTVAAPAESIDLPAENLTKLGIWAALKPVEKTYLIVCALRGKLRAGLHNRAVSRLAESGLFALKSRGRVLSTYTLAELGRSVVLNIPEQAEDWCPPVDAIRAAKQAITGRQATQAKCSTG